MDDLTAFLRDRYDEAFAAADSSPDVGRYDEVELQAKFDMPGYHAEYYASVPASLRRAEITAKRQIIALHSEPEDGGMGWGSPEGGYGSYPHACSTCGVADEYAVAWPCPTLRLLALPHAGHPDFREEWKL